MNRTFRRYQALFIFGIPVLLIGLMILLAGSSLFQRHPEALSLGITLDLVFTVPLLYLVLIRKKNIPKITMVPFFIAGIVIASLILPEDRQFYLSRIRQWVLPVVEITIFSIVLFKVIKTIKTYKKQRNTTPDFYTALKQAATEVLPNKIGVAFATEIAVLYYGFFNWKKRTTGPGEFSYHKTSGITGLLSVFIALILIETSIVHILLQKWSVTAAWIVSGISLYTAVQIFGIIRSMSKRPIAIRDGILKLRYGLLSETLIPLADIETIEISSGAMEFTGLQCKLSPLKDIDSHNTIIRLKEQGSVSRLYGFRKNYTTIAFYVDEKERFKKIVQDALQHYK